MMRTLKPGKGRKKEDVSIKMNQNRETQNSGLWYQAIYAFVPPMPGAWAKARQGISGGPTDANAQQKI